MCLALKSAKEEVVMLESDCEFTSLYFINCIRSLPIFPISEPDPNKRRSLKHLTQGRHPKEKEVISSEELDETAINYITSVASSEEPIDNIMFDHELQKMMKQKGKYND